MRSAASTTCTIALKSFHIHSDFESDNMYESAGTEVICGGAAEVSWKGRKTGRGARGGGRSRWGWSGCGNWKRDVDEWRRRSTQFRSSQTRIHHGSIHLHGRIANAERTSRRRPTNIYIHRPSENGQRMHFFHLSRTTSPQGHAHDALGFSNSITLPHIVFCCKKMNNQLRGVIVDV